jgi:hypothetical protein
MLMKAVREKFEERCLTGMMMLSTIVLFIRFRLNTW